jgi:hypothetical protein
MNFIFKNLLKFGKLFQISIKKEHHILCTPLLFLSINKKTLIVIQNDRIKIISVSCLYNLCAIIVYFEATD